MSAHVTVQGIEMPLTSAHRLRQWLDAVPLHCQQLATLKARRYLVEHEGAWQINPALLPEFVRRFPSGRVK